MHYYSIFCGEGVSIIWLLFFLFFFINVNPYLFILEMLNIKILFYKTSIIPPLFFWSSKKVAAWYCICVYRFCLFLQFFPIELRSNRKMLNVYNQNKLIDWFLVLNATFSNISAISWRSVLVVEEAGIPGENHRPCTSNW